MNARRVTLHLTAPQYEALIHAATLYEVQFADDPNEEDTLTALNNLVGNVRQEWTRPLPRSAKDLER